MNWDRFAKVIVFLAGWALGLLAFVLLMAPLYWITAGREESPRPAVIAGVSGLVLGLPAVMTGKWWNKRYGRRPNDRVQEWTGPPSGDGGR